MTEWDEIREEMSATGKLGGLTSILHKYMDQAGIPQSTKVQRRVRMMSIMRQQDQLEIKRLRLQLDMMSENIETEKTE